MTPNPFQCLSIEETTQKTADKRPTTPTNKIVEPAIPNSPRKKAKRKASTTYPPKEEPKKALAQKSAIEYLYLAKDALYMAIEAEKRALEESYVEDNDIKLLYNELNEVINLRPILFRNTSSDTELDIQLHKINFQLERLENGLSTKQAPKQTIKLPQQASTKKTETKTVSTAPISFAEALKKPQPQQVVPKVNSYRDRRLILQGTAKRYLKIDSKGLRDTLNKAFKEKNQILSPVIGTVTKSQKNGDIILSTTEKFDADFLKKNEATWKPLIDFNKSIRDTTWHKVVLHGIPTDIFNKEDGMTILEEELKVFNGLTPISIPRWLSSSGNRAKNQYGSAIVSFETKSEVDRALRNRLQIAGISVKTAEYIRPKTPNAQCVKCLKYGHSELICYRTQKCALCAGNHARQDHFCALCHQKGQKCAHTKLKCSNCQKEHEATDKSCDTYKDLSKRSIKPRTEVFSHVEIPVLGKNRQN